MKKRMASWNWILENLQQGIAIMLLYVVESSGSSPGRQGFFMAVNSAGEIAGSVGGGIMEHKFVEMAKVKLAEKSTESSVHKQYHTKGFAKNQSGMICSGEQTIVVYAVRQKDQTSIAHLVSSLQQNANGTLRLSPKGLHFEINVANVPSSFSFIAENEWIYIEKTGIHDQLYIIGGGHCSLAFSAIMSTLDFKIHLYDTREGLNTLEENRFADNKLVIADYSNLGDLISPGEHSYVVIMTFGYRSDYIALKSLIRKDFKYLGVLGSKKKIKKVFEDLGKEGISQQELSKLHAPAGIPIKSETPEEIAISIAAEIIRIKNMDS